MLVFLWVEFTASGNLMNGSQLLVHCLIQGPIHLFILNEFETQTLKELINRSAFVPNLLTGKRRCSWDRCKISSYDFSILLLAIILCPHFTIRTPPNWQIYKKGSIHTSHALKIQIKLMSGTRNAWGNTETQQFTAPFYYVIMCHTLPTSWHKFEWKHIIYALWVSIFEHWPKLPYEVSMCTDSSWVTGLSITEYDRSSNIYYIQLYKLLTFCHRADQDAEVVLWLQPSENDLMSGFSAE